MRIEKADRFWSAPSGTKPQVSCAWRVTLRGNAQRFSPTVTDATERTITMRMKFCTQSSTHHFLTIFHGNMSGALKLDNRNCFGTKDPRSVFNVSMCWSWKWVRYESKLRVPLLLPLNVFWALRRNLNKWSIDVGFLMLKFCVRSVG